MTFFNPKIFIFAYFPNISSEIKPPFYPICPFFTPQTDIMCGLAMYLIEIRLICDSYFFDPCGRIHGVAARANRALTLEQFGLHRPVSIPELETVPWILNCKTTPLKTIIFIFKTQVGKIVATPLRQHVCSQREKCS